MATAKGTLYRVKTVFVAGSMGEAAASGYAENFIRPIVEMIQELSGVDVGRGWAVPQPLVTLALAA
jgi:hypothetical protein